MSEKKEVQDLFGLRLLFFVFFLTNAIAEIKLPSTHKLSGAPPYTLFGKVYTSQGIFLLTFLQLKVIAKSGLNDNLSWTSVYTILA